MKYILYARKSSEDKSKQILSLESQMAEMKKLASNLGLDIALTYTESKSAKLPNNRPLFSEMIKLLENSSEDYGIICWKIDRLSRNPIDSGKIQWLLQQGHIKVIQTSDRQYLPSDNVLLLNIEGSMATQYILDLSKNVKRGIQTKIEKGLWPNFAPIGYLNDGKGGILVDRVRARYIKKIFKLYSSGNYTMKELADLMYKEGFRSRSNIKYHKSKIYKLINDPFYCGTMLFHGKEYPGKHETIISRKLFNECQKAMDLKQHPKKKRIYFPFRGLMTCAKCGCLLTASRKKKKYVYYYCTNARGNCSEHNHYLREDEAIKALSEVFDRLVISEEMVEIMYQNSLEFFINNNPERREYLEAKQGLENELRRYENRKDELFNLLLDKTITKEDYELREKTIISEINNFTSALKKLENEQEVVLTEKDLELTKEFFLSPKKQKKAFLKVSLDDKRKMLSGLVWNLSIDNKKLAKVSFKEPFETLANSAKNTDIDNLRRVGRSWNGFSYIKITSF
ncbi:MAG: recombinase family protein [Clostridia bacterium]|nr:recombinase family protein [Clostridia bacterium]